MGFFINSVGMFTISILFFIIQPIHAQISDSEQSDNLRITKVELDPSPLDEGGWTMD